jgi:ferredoxin
MPGCEAQRYQGAPKNELATFDKLNPWYYSDAPKTVRPMLDILRRKSTFEEVQGGLDESNALFEARRCLSCGNCFECDNCYGVCPDNAVIKLRTRQGIRVQPGLLQGLWNLCVRVPLWRHQDGARRHLTRCCADTAASGAFFGISRTAITPAHGMARRLDQAPSCLSLRSPGWADRL